MPSDTPFGVDDDLGQTAGGWEKWDQAGLQCMVDVALAREEHVRWPHVFRQFLVPTAVSVIDEAMGNRAPDQAVAVFVKAVGGQVLTEEVSSAYCLAHRPP